MVIVNVVQREYVSYVPIDFWYPDLVASRPNNPAKCEDLCNVS